MPALGVEGAAQRGDAGPGALGAVEPRVEQLVVLGGRAEVPQHRLAAARQHREPDQLVHRPGADVGGGHVADVREVEGEQAAERGRLERGVQPRQPLGAQAVEVDALLPVDGVGPVGADRHRITGFLGMPSVSESMPAARGCQVSLHSRSGTAPAERGIGWTTAVQSHRTRERGAHGHDRDGDRHGDHPGAAGPGDPGGPRAARPVAARAGPEGQRLAELRQPDRARQGQPVGRHAVLAGLRARDHARRPDGRRVRRRRRRGRRPVVDAAIRRRRTRPGPGRASTYPCSRRRAASGWRCRASSGSG